MQKNPRPAPRCFDVEWVGRGDAKQDQHLHREPGDFVVAVAEVFSFREDWHQDDRAGPLGRQYQLRLDAVLRDRPDLENCAVQCCHCGIRFFTHPRNAGRQNLRCPFGCRSTHCRQQATERSKRHYQTDKGRRNKKRLNGKRSQAHNDSKNAPPLVAPPKEDSTSSRRQPAPAEPTVAEAPRKNVSLTLEGFVPDEPTLVNSSMLSYLAMVASMIEGHTISREKLLQVLRRSMRQRSFDRLPRREYVLGFLNQHPP